VSYLSCHRIHSGIAFHSSSKTLITASVPTPMPVADVGTVAGRFGDQAYKRTSRNHLSDQIESFRIGDKDSKREDDLLDTFCYGIAIGLGNSEGF
jgi:hypothetical protein